MSELNNTKVAILATEGFEEVELAEPRKSLDKAGAETYLISPKRGSITAWDQTHWSDQYEVDVPLDEADPDDYDALLLPGGVLNPDKLRMDEQAVSFVNSFMESGKPIAAICHGPWTLIETGKLKGRKMTSYPSLKTDLKNAGANWVDEEVVTDRGLVTSRNPDDLPAFIEKMKEEFREGVHQKMARH